MIYLFKMCFKRFKITLEIRKKKYWEKFARKTHFIEVPSKYENFFMDTYACKMDFLIETFTICKCPCTHFQHWKKHV